MRHHNGSSGNNFCLAIRSENAPEKPRWIVIGFQTGKSGDQTQNPAIRRLPDFASDLKNMYVMLNSTRYPAVDYNLSLANQQFSRAYGDASLFGIRCFGMDELITRSNISPADYKTLYSLFVFDVSKQSEKLVYSRRRSNQSYFQPGSSCRHTSLCSRHVR